MLEETGEPYELIIVGDRASRLADPDYLRLHPLGRVPVLDDGDTSIFESGALCLHIADKYPDARLMPPQGTAQRGLVYQWAFFAYTELQAKVSFAYSDSQAAAAQVSRPVTPEAAQVAYKALAQAVNVVAHTLDGRPYLVGDRFTVADVLVAAALGVARRLEINCLPAPVLHYLDAMDARPAKRRADAHNAGASSRIAHV